MKGTKRLEMPRIRAAKKSEDASNEHARQHWSDHGDPNPADDPLDRQLHRAPGRRGAAGRPCLCGVCEDMMAKLPSPTSRALPLRLNLEDP